MATLFMRPQPCFSPSKAKPTTPRGKMRRTRSTLSAAIPRLAGQRDPRSSARTRRGASASHNPNIANTARNDASRTIASCLCNSSSRLGRRRLMIVADLPDLAVHHLHHFCTDRLDLPASSACSREERLGHPSPAIAGTHTQLAVRIREQREFGFVRTPHFGTARQPLSIRADQHGFVVKTRHYCFDVMPIKSIEVTLDQLLFGSHKRLLNRYAAAGNPLRLVATYRDCAAGGLASIVSERGRFVGEREHGPPRGRQWP